MSSDRIKVRRLRLRYPGLRSLTYSNLPSWRKFLVVDSPKMRKILRVLDTIFFYVLPEGTFTEDFVASAAFRVEQADALRFVGFPRDLLKQGQGRVVFDALS